MFSGGQVVHAMTRTLRGEAAALEILSWQHGSVEPCRLQLPEHPSITRTWQELVLRSAQRINEQRKDDRPVPEDLDDVEWLSSGEPETGASSERVRRRVIRAARLDARGQVVVARGDGDQEEFAELSAYAARMTQVVGEALGMTGFRALEWTLPDRNGLAYLEENGGLAALEALPQADLNALRRRVGL